MFVTVRFGNDEHLLFNSHCKIQVLIDDIKKRCRCLMVDTIDLAGQQARIEKISEQPVFQYANTTLQPRMTYILVKVKSSIDEKTGEVKKIYIPLLMDLDWSNPDYRARLSKKRQSDILDVTTGNETRVLFPRTVRKKKGYVPKTAFPQPNASELTPHPELTSERY